MTRSAASPHRYKVQIALNKRTRVYGSVSLPPFVVTRIKKKKKKKERAQSESRRSQRKEVTGIANPDGREEVRRVRTEGSGEGGNDSGVATGGGNADGDSAWKRKQRGSLIHPGLYQNLITSEAKATPKEKSRERARAKPPPKSRQRGGLPRWLYSPSPPPPPSPYPVWP